MIHHCNLHCHTIDPVQVENLQLTDHGKWLPFTFHMDMVVGCKMTTDDVDDQLYNCTTLFSEQGDTFIIDTTYNKFSLLYTKYHSGSLDSPSTEPEL